MISGRREGKARQEQREEKRKQEEREKGCRSGHTKLHLQIFGAEGRERQEIDALKKKREDEWTVRHSAS